MNFPKELRPTDKIEVQLFDGTIVNLPTAHPKFPSWKEARPDFDFGKKPILNYKKEACFAELIILRLLLDQGWDGAWIETYGGTHYLRSMPKAWNLQSEHISIPKVKEDLLQKIWKTAKTKACFDVLAWHGDQLAFFEAKRKGKDKLTSGQIKFIKGALECGISPESLIIVEWEEAALSDFQYPEDKKFFINLLTNGDENQFDKKYKDCFDFRDPKIKRKEFNLIRNKVFKQLLSKYGKRCRLKIHPDCSKINKFDIDHFIPLSTNELNKKLRKMKPANGRKVPAQSFGSNNIKNLIIACSRCSAFKKHRIIAARGASF